MFISSHWTVSFNICSSSCSLQNKDPHLGGGYLVGLGVEMGGFRDQGVETGRLGICKVGGVGSGSNLAPWILCSACYREGFVVPGRHIYLIISINKIIVIKNQCYYCILLMYNNTEVQIVSATIYKYK